MASAPGSQQETQHLGAMRHNQVGHKDRNEKVQLAVRRRSAECCRDNRGINPPKLYRHCHCGNE
jgi:hypothetical protein